MNQLRVTRKRYNGREKGLVIALDVGTTFSGVSYTLLDPGEIPKTHEVTRCVRTRDSTGGGSAGVRTNLAPILPLRPPK